MESRQVWSEGVGSGRVGSDRVGSGWVGSGRVGPGRFMVEMVRGYTKTICVFMDHISKTLSFRDIQLSCLPIPGA